MSQYLDMCQEVVNNLSIQGTVSSVELATGLHRDVVLAVKNAWKDIQTYREDWRFMIGDISSFSTTVDKIEYTPMDVFGMAYADLSTYKTKESIFYNYESLRYIEYDQLPYLNNDTSSRPRWYSINFVNNNLILTKPDDAYNLVIRYNRALQILSANTDEPFIPAAYHKTIVYRATYSIANTIGNYAKEQEYKNRYSYAIGEMMRVFLGKKTVETRGIA